MSEKLGLDPGSGRRRKPMSICRCLCWIIGLPVVCFTAWAVISYGHEMVQGVRFPHKFLYHTGPSYDAGNVIRPLISDEQTFDIAVSVWLRAPEDEEAEYKRLRGPVSTEEAAAVASLIDLGGKLGKMWMDTRLDEGNTLYSDEDVLEKPLFSDIVFRGLRLSDRHASAKVDFRLPTARFLAPNLAESDLRATFLLIPSSPSLMDHIKNFSSWMPDSVYAKRRPTRPWPFPLGSDERGDKTIADLALESFAVSVPLLEFHAVASQCDTVDASEGPVVEVHPYVVTRTQLRIIRETGLFNATAYNDVRDQIKVHSCGQGIPGIRPNLRMCRRSSKSIANFETRLELEAPMESGVETQWAYAPFLDTKEHAAGPLDIIPVPVNRENCSSTPRDAYMDVSWRIAFSAKTPAKHFLADTFVSPESVDHRASDLMKVSQQDNAELWNGALGHRFHDDAHPRRRIGLSIISCVVISSFSLHTILSTYRDGSLLLSELFLFHYWWTRVSTAGISTSSVAFLAPAKALELLELLSDDADFGTVFAGLFFLLLPSLMCKAVTRAQFGWKKWYPTLTRVPANHRERASQRIDSRTSWGTKFGVFAASLAVYHFLKPDKIILILTTLPAPRPGEYGPFEDSVLVAFLRSAAQSLICTGIFSQVLLNHRSATFGGAYRAQVVLRCVGSIVGLLHFVPAATGRMEGRMGLTLNALMEVCICLPLLWQAVTLPLAEIGDDEED
ncbi:hypothetical protein B0H17DRAFT_1028090 [Mycena rosella]|uniref:Uncharacterized protein n=1 Tax=Mycena rosella TaxID=1033263 RepID=A0AAD7MBI2_MYCRO|nr:hypothetical protein B0H17DRAFT_1028090 [Mycena rosella]